MAPTHVWARVDSETCTAEVTKAVDESTNQVVNLGQSLNEQNRPAPVESPMKSQVPAAIDEHSTLRSRVTLEMMGEARLAIKNSDNSIVEVSLGGQGEIGNRQRTIFLEVSHGTSVLHAMELGENAARIVERLWSVMVPADYTIVVSHTGPPARSSHELDERIIVEGSKGRFESDISWR